MKAKKNDVWIFINGQLYVTNYNMCILDLLNFLGDSKYKTEFITEYNHTILPNDKFSSTYIKQFDKIEFITIVGGG